MPTAFRLSDILSGDGEEVVKSQERSIYPHEIADWRTGQGTDPQLTTRALRDSQA